MGDRAQVVGDRRAFDFVEEGERVGLRSSGRSLSISSGFGFGLLAEPAQRLDDRVDVFLFLGAELARRRRGAAPRSSGSVRVVGVDRGQLAGEDVLRISASAALSATAVRRAASPPPPQAPSASRDQGRAREEQGAAHGAAARDSVPGHGEAAKPMSYGTRRGAGRAGGARSTPAAAARAWSSGARPCAADPPRRYRGEDYWARPARRLRRPGGAAGDRRPGPGRPRRQPHRPDVHRRPLRRLALRGPAPGRLRQPARVGAPRRRAAPARRLRHRGRPLRAAGQQADAGGARQLPPLPGARAGAARALPGRSSPSAPSAGTGSCAPPRALGVEVPRPKPRFGHGAEADARPLAAARLLPPEPAEHLHRQADRADDRRRLRAGARSWPASPSFRLRARPRCPLRRLPPRTPQHRHGDRDPRPASALASRSALAAWISRTRLQHPPRSPSISSSQPMLVDDHRRPAQVPVVRACRRCRDCRAVAASLTTVCSRLAAQSWPDRLRQRGPFRRRRGSARVGGAVVVLHRPRAAARCRPARCTRIPSAL